MLLILLLHTYNLLLATGDTRTERQYNQQTYYEDLSTHRLASSYTPPPLPDYFFLPISKKSIEKDTPIDDIAPAIEKLLEELKHFYQTIPTLPGYTIQAYIGSQRKLAFQIREKIITYHPHLEPTIHYNQPNFVIHVGRFLEKLETYPLYVGIKKIIPQAIIRPDYFPNQPNILTPLCFIAPSIFSTEYDRVETPVAEENVNEL
jgi:hypothetical protein